jgi:hypothetical protein
MATHPPTPEEVHAAALVMGAAAAESPKTGRPRKQTSIRGETGYVMTRDDAVQVLHWKLFKGITAIPGDVREYIERIWAARIPHLYEELFLMAKDNQPINPNAIDLLKTMTLMTRTLTPASIRADSNADAYGLPSDVDLSHISSADLARMTNKQLSAPLDHDERDRKAAHAKMMRQKKADAAAGKREKTGPHSTRRKKTAVKPDAPSTK